MKRTTVTKIPFDREGNLLHYSSGVYIGAQKIRDTPGTEWRDNVPMRLGLKFIGFSRGRSAAYANFEDEHGHNYPVFLTDLEEVLLNTPISYGRIYANWIGCKRGTNYGIKLAPVKNA